jgi:hypothetical protein
VENDGGPGEAVGVEVGHGPRLAELLDDEVAGILVVLPGALRQFAGIDEGLLGVEEPVAHILRP